MTPAARLQEVIDLITLVLEHTQQPCDKILNRYFRDHRYIGSKDKQWIAGLFYKVLRYGLYFVSRTPVDPEIARKLVLSVLCYVEDYSLEMIGNLCTGGKYGPSPFDKKHDLFPYRSMAEALPPHLATLFQNSFSTETELRAFLTTCLDQAPIDVRVNTLKTTREFVYQTLKNEDIHISLTPLSPLGIRIEKPFSLERHHFFNTGFIEVQDEGSQLLALLCEVKPGLSVLDYCAGAGGKTLALAALMENRGQIMAADVSPQRLKNAKMRLKRAGAQNVQMKSCEDVIKAGHKYDRVVLDVPCSGTGTLRRNPDILWRLTPDKMAHYQSLQHEILRNAAPFVKPGGTLIYCTCSVMRAENQDQIRAFLNENPAFDIHNPGYTYGTWDNGVVLSPHKTHTDGFYGCVLKRKG